jgi:hypothetical protein
MVRRTDMIRFGKYEGTWTKKQMLTVKKRPLPNSATAIDAASNLPVICPRMQLLKGTIYSKRLSHNLEVAFLFIH